MSYRRAPWRRVNPSSPCPICERPDWCLLSLDDTAAICARVESSKRCGQAGWLHRLTDDRPSPRPTKILLRSSTDAPDLGELAAEFRRAATPDALARLASHLGVSVESLRAFGVGWSSSHRAWSFPMADPRNGRITGIRLRKPDGSKFSVRGGKEALFMPHDLVSPHLLLICEGASDALAAFTLGFASVGRPSCQGGAPHLLALARQLKPQRVVIIADGDAPGMSGASALARQLALHCRDVRTVCPMTPHKDLHAWLQAGGTAAELAQLIESAPSPKLTLRMQ